MHKSMLMLRGILIASLLMLVSYQFGERLVMALIPIYHWLIGYLESGIQLSSLSIVRMHNQSFLQLDFVLTEPFFIGADYIVPHQPFQNSANLPIGNVLLPLVCAFAIVIAWPVQRIAEYGYRFVVIAPSMMLVMLVDIPMQLVHLIWDGMQSSLTRYNSPVGILGYWCDFLNGGGLVALSATCGVFAVAAGQCLVLGLHTKRSDIPSVNP